MGEINYKSLIDKVLKSIIDTEFIKLYNTKTTQLKNGQRISGHFSKEDIQISM